MIAAPDVLRVAAQLLAQDSEASHRSAASRAYFAAFLHMRAQVDSGDGPLPRRSASDHGRVERAVALRNASAARTIALLRSVRNQADYDLQDDFSFTRAEVAVRLARRMLAVTLDQ